MSTNGTWDGVIEWGISEELGLALTIIPTITGTISFISSVVLIRTVFKEKKQQRSREKILVGLSFQCMLFSAACAMSTFTAPADMDPFTNYILRGNVATCNLQGFLYQAGISSPLYNSCLCVYYVLIVKYQRTDQDLRRCVIPTMHVITLGWAFGSAIAALALELYNYGGILGCWIDDNHQKWCDQGLDLVSCGRGENHDTLSWVFGALPVLLSLFITIVSTAVLYCTVRAQEKRSRAIHEQQYANPPRGRSVDIQSSVAMSSLGGGDSVSIDRLSIARDSLAPTETIVEGNEEDKTEPSVESSKTPPSLRTTGSGFFNRWRSERKSKMSRTVRDSGLLYVIAFWTTYTPFLIIGIYAASGSNSPNWIRIMHVLLMPSQGLFNVIIYRMPKCLKKRRSSSDEGAAAIAIPTLLQRRLQRAQQQRIDLDRATNRDASLFSSVQLPSTASMNEEHRTTSIVQFDIPVVSETNGPSEIMDDSSDDGEDHVAIG